MSRAIEMVFYTGYACRWIHTFLKPLIRHGSSKHMWPGAQAFLKIKGVPHFNGDNEVDRKARSFLNRVGTTDDGHSIKKSVVQDEAAMEKEEQKLKQELKDMDVEFKAMNALIDKCASAVSELEKFLTTKATRPLDASELTQVKDALARAGFNVDEVEKSKFSFRGDIKIVKPDGPEVLPKVKTDKSSHTYKAFPTIEVPLVSPDKEAQSSDALNPAKSGVSNVKKESELNQKTRMLDESKSRILMRYALLKALYVLEVGGSNCKAQVAFSNPRKLKCN